MTNGFESVFNQPAAAPAAQAPNPFSGNRYGIHTGASGYRGTAATRSGSVRVGRVVFPGLQLREGPSFVGQATGALASDIARQESALGRRRDAIAGQIDEFEELDTSAGAIVNDIDLIGRDLESLGAKQVGATEDAEERAIREFEDTTTQQVQTATESVERRFENRRRLLLSGLREDGQPFSPGERLELERAFNADAQREIRAATTDIYSRFNEARLQARVAFSQQRIGSQEGQRALSELSANIRSSARLAALNFRLQNRTAIASLATEPEDVVSYFAGLAALSQIATSPGGLQIPALPLGNS